MVITECNEVECPNCNRTLTNFITMDKRHEGYCSNHSCNFSTNYDQNYHIAWYYYRNHGENIEGFRFYDGKIDFSEETPQTIKPSVYTLDMSEIFGHESVKEIITDVINSEKAINLILSGSPSTSKTFFLKLVKQSVEAQGAKTLFVDCATSSFSGLVAEIDRLKPQFCFLDELECFDYRSQKALLNLLEFQTIHLTKSRNTKTIHVPHLKILATCNLLNRLLEPLRSRMLIMYLKAPNELEFKFIARKMLQSRYDYITEDLAEYIGKVVWNTQNPYERLVDRIGIMVKNDPTRSKVDSIIDNLQRYKIPKWELSKLKVQR